MKKGGDWRIPNSSIADGTDVRNINMRGTHEDAYKKPRYTVSLVHVLVGISHRDTAQDVSRRHNPTIRR